MLTRLKYYFVFVMISGFPLVTQASSINIKGDLPAELRESVAKSSRSHRSGSGDKVTITYVIDPKAPQPMSGGGYTKGTCREEFYVWAKEVNGELIYEGHELVKKSAINQSCEALMTAGRDFKSCAEKQVPGGWLSGFFRTVKNCGGIAVAGSSPDDVRGSARPAPFVRASAR